MDLVACIDSRIWLPPENELPRGFVSDLKKAFTHSNPEFHVRRAMGRATYGCPDKIRTCEVRLDPKLEIKRLTLPRGGVSRLRGIASEHGIRLRWIDRRVSVPVQFPAFAVDPRDPLKDLRWYQREAIEAVSERQGGIVRAPTGSGKTIAALGSIATMGERTLVVVRDANLLKQWVEAAQRCLGLSLREIGIVRGGRKYKPGPRLTIGLQQSLYAKGNCLDELLRDEPFGHVVMDEAQTIAAKTFQLVIDRFPAKVRSAWSADETRRDGKEFLTYDAVGDVVYEVSRDVLEEERVIVPVDVRLVTTHFDAPWYTMATAEERDTTRLISEIAEDEDRNEIVIDLVKELVARGEYPILAFTHLREHAIELADRELSVRHGIPCGLLLGGPGADSDRFQDDRAKLLDGRLKVAIGTYRALGVGHDLPAVRAGIAITPISKKNPQFFNQVRGRICRSDIGKDAAFLYYVWDPAVFPRMDRAIASWNDKRVQTRTVDGWAQVKAR